MRRLLPIVVLLVLWVPSAQAWTWPVVGPVLQGFSFDPAHPYAAGHHSSYCSRYTLANR